MDYVFASVMGALISLAVQFVVRHVRGEETRRATSPYRDAPTMSAPVAPTPIAVPTVPKRWVVVGDALPGNISARDTLSFLWVAKVIAWMFWFSFNGATDVSLRSLAMLCLYAALWALAFVRRV